MSIEEISSGLESLQMGDDSVISLLTKKGDNLNVLSDSLDNLIAYSKDAKHVNTLYELLINDSDSFLSGLYRVGDKKAIVLFNTLSKHKVSSEIIQNILSVIRLKLKKDIHIDINRDVTIDIPLEIFYVNVYLNLITQFDISIPHHIQVLLGLLNPIAFKDHDEDYKEISRLVLLIIVKNINLNKSKTIEIIEDYLEILYEDDQLTMNQFLNMVDVLELIFPILPEVATQAYTNDKTKDHIIGQVSEISQGSLQINRLRIIHLLNLINSSCIVDHCRSYNSTNFFHLLKLGTEFNQDEEIQILSTLDIIKLWNFVELNQKKESDLSITIEQLGHIITDWLRTKGNVKKHSTILEYCIEALAYLTLNGSIKQSFRNDESIIEKLVTLLEQASQATTLNTSLTYGLLLILTNLTKLKGENSDKSTLKFLKDYANAATTKQSHNSEEDQSVITLFNKSLLIDHHIVDIISRLKTVHDDSSTKMIGLLPPAISIIGMISLTKEKKVKEELVKQGALNIILNFLIKYSTITKTDTNTNIGETRPINEDTTIIDTRVMALQALARIIISVNPLLAFKKYDVKTCIPFLVELLGPDISQYTDSGLNSSGQYPYLFDLSLVDKFDALLALTNLSSIDNNDIKTQIITRTFEQHLNNLMLDSDNPQVQTAAWELISNLITEPLLLAKFFNIDESMQNSKRLEILIKLMNSQHIQLQITIAGLLANATEFEMISSILMSKESIRNKLIHTICEICQGQSDQDDLIERIAYILLNLVYGSNDQSRQWLATNNELKQALATVVKTSTRRDIIEVILESVKLLK
ncbi:protein required for mother cell-specific HO expression [Scheffersomyces amazonensis]|uniref:protein required for mother cell-specific HO expression n=1 Tax=Scheffersomyces amazonensis TaxID=1078765 RepID=UPI00315DDF85